MARKTNNGATEMTAAAPITDIDSKPFETRDEVVQAVYEVLAEPYEDRPRVMPVDSKRFGGENEYPIVTLGGSAVSSEQAENFIRAIQTEGAKLGQNWNLLDEGRGVYGAHLPDPSGETDGTIIDLEYGRIAETGRPPFRSLEESNKHRLNIKETEIAAADTADVVLLELGGQPKTPPSLDQVTKQKSRYKIIPANHNQTFNASAQAQVELGIDEVGPSILSFKRLGPAFIALFANAPLIAGGVSPYMDTGVVMWDYAIDFKDRDRRIGTIPDIHNLEEYVLELLEISPAFVTRGNNTFRFDQSMNMLDFILRGNQGYDPINDIRTDLLVTRATLADDITKLMGTYWKEDRLCARGTNEVRYARQGRNAEMGTLSMVLGISNNWGEALALAESYGLNDEQVLSDARMSAIVHGMHGKVNGRHLKYFVDDVLRFVVEPGLILGHQTTGHLDPLFDRAKTTKPYSPGDKTLEAYNAGGMSAVVELTKMGR